VLNQEKRDLSGNLSFDVILVEANAHATPAFSRVYSREGAKTLFLAKLAQYLAQHQHVIIKTE
jgi:hypothetical protein